MKHNGMGTLLCSLLLLGCARQPAMESLVPKEPSGAPDYMCTWNLQGYVTSYAGNEQMRRAMNEENLFGKGAYQNWAELFPAIRADLYFVMDDSWDIPQEENAAGDNPYLGTVELNEERFPSFKGTPAERLKQLTQRLKKLGWKGAGGWICAQRAPRLAAVPEEDYWTERLRAAHEAGFSYWKVDWGREAGNDSWRRMLTELGRKHAPQLWIEHAMKYEYVEFSDVFRTYDVENVIAQPVTIQRVAQLLPRRAADGAKGIVNCEDEPYIAAGLGCAIGIMRHPFAGSLPDGRQDEAFPPVGHNYKKCLDEVVRAVRWHRLAEPFAVDGRYAVDSVWLTDTWELRENETWNKGRPVGTVLCERAPARVSRGMPLPEVADTSALRPYVLASRYPNGAVAVAAIGRAAGREYVEREAAVTVAGSDWQAPVGLFGRFGAVTLVYPSVPAEMAGMEVWAQDLAGDSPVNITSEVKMEGNRLTVPGTVITRVGLMNATPGDKSAPGLVLKMRLPAGSGRHAE